MVGAQGLAEKNTSGGRIFPKAIVAVNERLCGNANKANLQLNLSEAQLVSAKSTNIRSKLQRKIRPVDAFFRKL